MAEGFPPLLIWASTTMRLSRRLYRRLLVPADHRFHLDVCGFLSETPSRHNMTWSVLWSRIVCLEIEKYIENYRNILILIIYIYTEVTLMYFFQYIDIDSRGLSISEPHCQYWLVDPGPRWWDFDVRPIMVNSYQFEINSEAILKVNTR